MHLQHLVDVLHLRARTCRHALLALGVHQFRPLSFLRGHGADDGIHVDEHLVVHPALRHRGLGLLHARHHACQHAQPAHILHLLQLHAQIVEVELALGHLLGERFGVFLLDAGCRLFDKADDVAHPENAARDALGIEGLDRVQFLARARELDRLAGDEAHGERRAAACIAVHPGEDDAGQRHFVGEALGDIDRVLTGQAVDHEQHFGRRRDRGDRFHLGHQRLVDMQAPRRIE